LVAEIRCGAVNLEIGCTDTTAILGAVSTDCIVDALAGLTTNNMDTRNAGKADKISLIMFIIHP
jgi:hypothetical protein